MVSFNDVGIAAPLEYALVHIPIKDVMVLLLVKIA